MDVTALRRSWRQFTVAGPRAVKYFYASLFVIAPETRTMFPTNMRYQEDKLLAALGHILTHVDDAEELTAFTHRLGADHRRFQARDADGNVIHLAEHHYIWVGQALLATLEHFLGTAWTPALKAEWAAAYEAVAKLMLAGAAESERSLPPYWEAQVLDVDRRLVDLVVLTVRPNYLCAYRPGQSLPVQLPDLRMWRYLSPANAPRPDGTIEFHVRATGRFSTHLVRRTGVGDRLLLGHPVGTTLSSYDRAPHRPLLLVAGGSGLAPLRAVVESLRQGPARSVTLVVGGKTPSDLYDHQALAMLASTASAGQSAGERWLRYVPTVEAGWGWEGAVGTAVDVALRLRSWEDSDVLVCGSPAMIRDTIRTLVDAGVPPDQILTETFDHTSYPPIVASPDTSRPLSRLGAR
ncbi:globin domain-containing protein [Plantactinospora sp. GCM10030261]|uniref:globin domain-containing protein n=1 Tax=Plantactinospora sp. GCM10030261 TaxID=3273420 RepID=UPI003609216A